MEILEFKNLPDTSTPISSENLNKVQQNVKDVFDGNVAMGSIVVDDVSCKNLFNKYTVVKGKYINKDDGTEGEYYLTSHSDYIDVSKYYNIISSGDTGVGTNGGAFFDSSKTYISGFSGAEIRAGVSVPTNAKYVIINVTIANLDTAQLEQGLVATAYTPHKKYGYEDTDWINATLLNDWQQVGTNYNQVQYRKVGNIVYIRGAILKNRAMTSNDDRTVFNLPEIFRPKNNNYGIHNGTGYNITLIGDVMFGDHINYTSGSWLSLDGLYFFVD